MLLLIPILTDYNVIRARRQTVIDNNARRMNCRHVFKDYVAGDEVLVKTYNPGTLQERAEGPFTVAQVNGMLTIQRASNVLERINIRRVRPYNR